MTIDWTLWIQILAPIIALFVGAWITRVFEKKAKLTVYLGHAASFMLKDIPLHTHSIVVGNAGGKAASNVHVGHGLLPEFYQIVPATQHRVEDYEDGGKDIVFEKLVPGEYITISYLYDKPIDFGVIHRRVKCDEGFAKVINMLPTRQFPKWFNILIVCFVLVGVATCVYGVIQVSLWIFELTQLTGG